MKGKKAQFDGFRCLALAAMICLLVSCGDRLVDINTSPTDVAVIGNINHYVSESDLRAGVVKTADYVSPVKLSHRKHERAGVDCFTCHHKKGNDDRIKECARCHKGERGEEQLHNFCITCHSQRAKGPVMCQDCHVPDAHAPGAPAHAGPR